MNYRQVLKHYGRPSKVAQALETERQQVDYWRRAKRIPTRWQYAIERDTEGKLKVDAKARREAMALVGAMPVNGNGHDAVK